jgi:DNA adenine methylase
MDYPVDCNAEIQPECPQWDDDTPSNWEVSMTDNSDATQGTHDPKGNQGWEQFFNEIKEKSGKFIETRNSSDHSLYELLQTTYNYRQKAEKDKKEFYKYTKDYYEKNGLGKVGNDIYTAILKISFESEYKDEKTQKNTKTKISSYSTALKYLEKTYSGIIKSDTGVIDALNDLGGIQETVTKAREIKKGTHDAPWDTDRQVVARNKPLHTFSYPKQKPGFKLALIHIDENGTANILNERDEKAEQQASKKRGKKKISGSADEDSVVAAALARAAAERYTRLSIPYIGNKTRYLRYLDKYLQEPIDEYREIFLGSGAVFLFLKATRPDDKIDYWLNDSEPRVIKWWRQVQLDPEPLIQGHKDYISQANGDKDKAKDILEAKLKPILKNDEIVNSENPEDILQTAIAYFTAKLWSFNWMDDYSVSKAVLTTDYNEIYKNIRATHKMLVGVRLTCLDFTKVVEAAPSKKDGKVLIFSDPPYESQESLYKNVGKDIDEKIKKIRSEEKADADKKEPDPAVEDNIKKLLTKKELEQKLLLEFHWKITDTLARSSHKWVMTHSDTKLFRSRSVFAALRSKAGGIKFNTVSIQSGFKRESLPEAITANYDPDTGTIPKIDEKKLEKMMAEVRKEEEQAAVSSSS